MRLTFSRLRIFAGYFPLYLPLMGREKTNRNFPDALLLEKISRFHFRKKIDPLHMTSRWASYLLKFSNILNFDKMLKYYLSKNPCFICCFLSHIGLYPCVSIVAGKQLHYNDVSSSSLFDRVHAFRVQCLLSCWHI